MNIVFRVDSSDLIGTGHLYRCLHMAHHYRDHNVYFICKKHPYNLNDKVAEAYTLLEIENGTDQEISLDMTTWLGESEANDAKKTIAILTAHHIEVDWLVVDHYAINSTWETMLRHYTKKIAVIDDFTTRQHDCDAIVNQQITPERGLSEYNHLKQRGCKVCCGNDYLLLNPRYFAYTDTDLTKSYGNAISRIAIFMGGADTCNTTETVLRTCIEFNENLPQPIRLDVVVGKANRHYEKLNEYVSAYPYVRMYYDIPFIGDVLVNADLSIGAPGTTSYERCITNTPSLCVCIAENQLTVVDKFIDAGCMKNLGTIEDDYQERLLYWLEYFYNNTKELQTMSEACASVVDVKTNKNKSILDIEWKKN